MLPRYNPYGGWPASGEIDIMESRGNLNYRNGGTSVGVDTVDTVGSTLHYGTNWSTNRWWTAHATVSVGGSGLFFLGGWGWGGGGGAEAELNSTPF
jgi:hypothetical protein